MKAEIISIGTELLLGHIVNTDVAFLSRKIAEIGIDIYYQTTIGDNPQRIIESVRKALSRSDVIITTGGLGPTIDDVTIQTISELIDKKDIKIIKNKVGSAPGLIAKCGNKIIICLPGPLRELKPMFEYDILSYLKKTFKGNWTIRSRTINTTGLAEAKVDAKVKDLLKLKPPVTVGIYAKLGEVDLKIMSKAKDEKTAVNAIKKIEKKIAKRLNGHIFGYDDETLESAVGKVLTKKKLTIATAESCTGGLLSDRLTNVSGSSKYFMTGIISYSNKSKESFLGISQKLMEKYGAVSRPVAVEMARAIKHFACVDIGISITGIAGPTGGTKYKPVGLVYAALVTDKKRIVMEFRFRGSREDIKFQASQAALNLIRKNT